MGDSKEDGKLNIFASCEGICVYPQHNKALSWNKSENHYGRTPHIYYFEHDHNSM
jgi:hypothetical protein